MKKSFLFGAGVFLLAGLSASTAPQKAPPPNQQKPPVNLLHCADVKVVSFSVTLISTQAGTPGVEFPHDTVNLTLTLENAGNIPLPSGQRLDFTCKRNDELIKSGSLIYSFSAPGSREEMKLGPDSFLHGVKTTYVFEVKPTFQECRADNNKAALTVDETRLHRGR